MLGLGDIVIPGIFIAFLLRFDHRYIKYIIKIIDQLKIIFKYKCIYCFFFFFSLKRKTNLYFNATFLAYFLGLLTTVFIMHVFKAAQPALLYLVPACLITPMLIALISGDLKALFR